MFVMADLLTIGDFSRMTFLTVKALRHYHDVGLLEPARIDQHSGYRFYRPEQVATARMIRRLRDLALPVDDVRTVLAAPDEQTRNAVIVAHLDRMSRQLRDTQDTVDSLRRMLAGDDEVGEVTYRTEPEQTVLAIRAVVQSEGAVSAWLDAFAELHRLLRSTGAERAGADGASFPTAFFTDGVAELIAFIPVAKEVPVSGRVELLTLPSSEVAVVTYDGPMVDLDAAYGAVGQAVVARAIAADGPVVERYLHDQPVTRLPEDLVRHRTEVCWPVLW
jgi:DNA-binding transcriptional MerR regulator